MVCNFWGKGILKISLESEKIEKKCEVTIKMNNISEDYFDFSKIEKKEDLEKYDIEILKNYLKELVSPLELPEIKENDQLFKIIDSLKKIGISLREDSYISEVEKYVSYLIEFDGKQRNNKLGILDEYYGDKKLAKKWFTKLSKVVHPDKLRIYFRKRKKNISEDLLNKPFRELKKLYDVMIDYEE